MPRGSEPAKSRPAVVMQEEWLLATEIATVLVVPLTSNLALEAFPGDVLVPTESSNLVAVHPEHGRARKECDTCVTCSHCCPCRSQGPGRGPAGGPAPDEMQLVVPPAKPSFGQVCLCCSIHFRLFRARQQPNGCSFSSAASLLHLHGKRGSNAYDGTMRKIEGLGVNKSKRGWCRRSGPQHAVRPERTMERPPSEAGPPPLGEGGRGSRLREGQISRDDLAGFHAQVKEIVGVVKIANPHVIWRFENCRRHTASGEIVPDEHRLRPELIIPERFRDRSFG